MFDVHLGAADVLSGLAIFTAVLRHRRDLVTAGARAGLHVVALDLPEEGCATALTPLDGIAPEPTRTEPPAPPSALLNSTTVR
jgi:hypothetical protein